MAGTTYDYVIIGSGSAGSVLAARLAEDASVSVLLLEAGPRDNHITINMPAALGLLLQNDRFNWFYYSEPEAALDGRRIHESRGRVLGGSSSINGLNWVRGNPWDYENWAALGNAGWDWAHVLPYFKKAESYHKGGDAWRGGDGPMRIETCPANNPLFDAFMQAGPQWGLPINEDHNAFAQEGTHITQRNCHGGQRWSAARGYIHAQPRKDNLTIMTGARVTAIELDGKRAVRVHVKLKSGDIAFEATREILLCGGALNSPQLLNLSGIGHAHDLKEAGIALKHDLPGVGRGLRDHVSASVMYRSSKDVSVTRQLTPLGKVKLGLQWMLFKSGLGTSNFFEVGGFFKTRPQEHIPNVQFEFVPMLGELQHGAVSLTPGFQYFFNLLRPKSSGRVWTETADPFAAPKFQFNYFQDADDLEQVVEAVKISREMVRQKAWDELRGAEVNPGPEIATDADLKRWVKTIAGTTYHPCCTCRMGSDDMAVVDAVGRVHGIEGLRVIDASIMPEIPSGNLNAPTIMMAEKLADAIKGRALPPDRQAYAR